MKKKTREIVVCGKEFSYVINQKYNHNSSNISLKISQRGFKKFTCTFLFCTWEDPVTGSPLLVGVALKNKKTIKMENYSLHYPITIRDFILYGMENGWTGENIIEFQDGLEIIGEMGYEDAWLRPGNRI
ncbi:hypothetical protein [Paenibacillus apiarius]|uniref:Uncharacterized protein n=1 Tax=Paenibacillus apiarius TaxID=46240 RepID=A0ABT4E1E9_9BACL|nr:hypothetical protein [Paenibacillus apiarius]MCY9516196.1 hypothetical protein [Paenibacillus apiarius]MCY9523427.1 hypothetical protein [Paenibacillus apiarius]MCY9555569.1 hypothetical protein [Paenibacillus apiarius]MCY9561557.1 hypothetical protein [Paenibacillus apiarius]MCY9687164.1 hypothetical protein [Paenibacillus apiarius]